MAKSVNKTFLSINGTDYTAYLVSHNLPMEREAQDSTTMNESTRVNLAGLKTWTLDLELLQDEVDNGLAETLFGLWDTAGNVLFILRPDKDAAVGVNNPNYTGNGFIQSITPVQGAVGEARKLSVSIAPVSPISRLVA